MSKNSQQKEKQYWAREKSKLHNARKLRRIYYIDPEDMKFKDIIKNARKELEVHNSRKTSGNTSLKTS